MNPDTLVGVNLFTRYEAAPSSFEEGVLPPLRGLRPNKFALRGLRPNKFEPTGFSTVVEGNWLA